MGPSSSVPKARPQLAGFRSTLRRPGSSVGRGQSQLACWKAPLSDAAITPVLHRSRNSDGDMIQRFGTRVPRFCLGSFFRGTLCATAVSLSFVGAASSASPETSALIKERIRCDENTAPDVD